MYKRQGVHTEAARGGRELVEADDEILHVLQLRDAHERVIGLLERLGQLVADAGVEVAGLLIDCLLYTSIFKACYDASVECGQPGNMMLGANVAGFLKVANAMMAQGLSLIHI